MKKPLAAAAIALAGCTPQHQGNQTPLWTQLYNYVAADQTHTSITYFDAANVTKAKNGTLHVWIKTTFNPPDPFSQSTSLEEIDCQNRSMRPLNAGELDQANGAPAPDPNPLGPHNAGDLFYPSPGDGNDKLIHAVCDSGE